MPTSYTADVMSGTITTLKDYALSCARGMGALISMRDEPWHAVIPRRFIPDTSYYDSRIETATQELARLTVATPEEIETLTMCHNKEILEYRAKRVRENDETRQRYTLMLEKVRAWNNAPEGLKEFMTQQLETSLEYDVSDDPLEYVEEPTVSPTEWYDARVKDLERQIKSYTKSRDEEIERTAKRNEWLAQLFKSLEGEV